MKKEKLAILVAAALGLSQSEFRLHDRPTRANLGTVYTGSAWYSFDLNDEKITNLVCQGTHHYGAAALQPQPGGSWPATK